MWMATRSDSGFVNDGSLSSMMNRHAFNFNPNTSSEMFPMAPYSGRNGFDLINVASSSNLIDSVSGVKLDTASMASDWSNEEQYKLEDGLEKYKDRPSIMKYIKIAATLPEKTVRDVALRCRWMTRKRRKTEDLSYGKRIGSSKDKQAEPSSKSSIPSVLPDNMASYPFSMPFASGDLSGHTVSLLEQNVRAFRQIRANLSTYKAEDNVDLFCQARNNLITIQNDMNNMPGLMNHMPPLPVAIDNNLSANLFSNSTFAMPTNRMQSGSFNMKQEPLG